MTITRKLEFDAGHRIPDHRSQCRNLHGHRYVLEITLHGGLISLVGASDRGMVMDFSDVKRLAIEHLVSVWDHALILYEKDIIVRSFVDTLPGHKTVVLNEIPTVENLAVKAFETLDHVYNVRYGINLQLVKVRLYETPNCWADITRD
ncbi:6-pyruvoyl trahydropterin synthase family protein [Candidatus Vallotia cooleyia]|uniref:6-pyruvoyl trahydropterin synthase family protein n=1 Tax=Candidatus Vallotiella adelgis TaxID=1177211 RepID=UPI001D020B24|nr:6-carboxytetrahydropterin synthase [Candidatus Vallotia cooleyia]